MIPQNSWAWKILANATQTTANVKSFQRLFSAEFHALCFSRKRQDGVAKPSGAVIMTGDEEEVRL